MSKPKYTHKIYDWQDLLFEQPEFSVCNGRVSKIRLIMDYAVSDCGNYITVVTFVQVQDLVMEHRLQETHFKDFMVSCFNPCMERVKTWCHLNRTLYEGSMAMKFFEVLIVEHTNYLLRRT